MKILAVAAIGVVTNDSGEVLITKRGEDEAADAENKWEFPGGGLEFDESVEEAVIREVKEETGYDVEVVRLLPKIYTNHWVHKNGDQKQVVLLAYHCKIIGGELKRNSGDLEIIDAKFIRPEDIINYDCLPKTKEIIDLLTS